MKDAVKELCSFLEKKLILVKKYLSITERLKERIQDRENVDLAPLFTARQNCIVQIERIDRSIKKIKEGQGATLSLVSDALKGLVEEHLKTIKSTLERAYGMDRALMVMVKEDGERIKSELLSMRHVRHAAQGYRKTKSLSPRFLDAVR
jgi:hypothetical protein